MIRPIYLLLLMYALAFAWASHTIAALCGDQRWWVLGIPTLLWADRTWRYLQRCSRA